jgi:hypothetical protein
MSRACPDVGVAPRLLRGVRMARALRLAASVTLVLETEPVRFTLDCGDDAPVVDAGPHGGIGDGHDDDAGHGGGGCAAGGGAASGGLAAGIALLLARRARRVR